MSGPTVLLKPEAGQALAMVFHKLTTNSEKYGALSTNGTNTIHDLIPYEFGDTVDLVFAPEGVRCHRELPLTG